MAGKIFESIGDEDRTIERVKGGSEITNLIRSTAHPGPELGSKANPDF
jgi:hypothetical protein